MNMNMSTRSVEDRIALYDHYRDRKRALQEEVFTLLGGKCIRCGSIGNLRVRFVDPAHPLIDRYRTNPGTLYRRISIEPDLRSEVHLLCRNCRLNQHSTAPGHAPLDRPTTEDVINDQSF
jgi:hypothetical protein